MQLYLSGGPNPRAVAMFVAEKEIVIERVMVDVRSGENREAPHLARNPLGTVPVLELESGACIADVMAICEYIEELFPDPPLIGTDAETRAITRMWARRINLLIAEPMVTGFRGADARAMFEPRMPLPSAAAAQELKSLAQTWLSWLDRTLGNRRFLCGDRFSMADILLFAFVRFGNAFGQALPEDAGRLRHWYDAVSERPSVRA